jgi:hypothetical protein
MSKFFVQIKVSDFLPQLKKCVMMRNFPEAVIDVGLAL